MLVTPVGDDGGGDQFKTANGRERGRTWVGRQIMADFYATAARTHGSPTRSDWDGSDVNLPEVWVIGLLLFSKINSQSDWIVLTKRFVNCYESGRIGFEARRKRLGRERVKKKKNTLSSELQISHSRILKFLVLSMKYFDSSKTRRVVQYGRPLFGTLNKIVNILFLTSQPRVKTDQYYNIT